MNTYRGYEQEHSSYQNTVHAGYTAKSSTTPAYNGEEHFYHAGSGNIQQQQQHQVPPQTEAQVPYLNNSDADGRLFAGLSYVGFWLSGLLVLLFAGQHRIARFHAMQSVLLFGGVTVLYFVFINIMIQHTPFIFGYAIFAFVIMNIIAGVSWIVGMVSGFSGTAVKLPFVGNFAQRYANDTTQVK